MMEHAFATEPFVVSWYQHVEPGVEWWDPVGVRRWANFWTINDADAFASRLRCEYGNTCIEVEFKGR